MKYDKTAPHIGFQDSLRLAGQVLCRVPAFATDSENTNRRGALLSLIHDATPKFYEQIQELDLSEWHTIPERKRITLWKYANRARYRATPFGRFASISLVGLKSDRVKGSSLILESKLFVHHLADWSEAAGAVGSSDNVLQRASMLVANPTVYRCGTAYRYVAEDQDQFVISGVAADEKLLGVLVFCREVRSKQAVFEFVQEQHGWSPRQAKNYLGDLVGNDLLLTDLHPNITGEDYFRRIGAALVPKRHYLISERKVLDGYLPEAKFYQLTEAVSLLHRVIPDHTISDLNTFKERFLRKFEYRTIPLLEALDPEMGVGYGDLERDVVSDKLVDSLTPTVETRSGKSLSEPYLSIVDRVVAGFPLKLEDMELADGKHRLKLPNTFSALVRLADNFVVVEQLGGVTATALLGRFSIAVDGVTNLARQLSRIESESNPEVLFFDVAYRGDQRADNINRRAHLYDYELPLLTWSTHPRALRLDDLMVSIVGGDVVLASRSLGKRVVPRMASAYNTRRSDLPIFRFLSDLQQQGLRTDLSIRLPEMLPGLSYYPRVQYKQVVLAPARWRIPDQFLDAKLDIAIKVPQFKQWLHDQGVSRWCRSGQADELLYFDTTKQDDVKMLLVLNRNRTGIYIEEALFADQPTVLDELGRSYQSEFVLSFTHTDRIYKPYAPVIADTWNRQLGDSLFLPGDEWVYVTLYLHPVRSTDFLVSVVKPFAVSQRKYLSYWFFVRYADPRPHIRLRFRLKTITRLAEFIKEFSDCIRIHMQSGIIQDMSWKAYRPEVERYGVAMRSVEACFSKSSDLVLALLTNNRNMDGRYASCIGLITETMNRIGWSLSKQLQFTKEMADAFSADLAISQSGFKAINKRYREWNNQSWELPPMLARKTRSTAKAIVAALNASPEHNRQRVAGDLFHMHINRLFDERQRVHEAVVYQFLMLRLRTREAIM